MIVPSITITEVFKHILRSSGEEAALRAIAHMEQGLVVSLDSDLANSAASYGDDLKLPLADSIIYATAQKYEATTWTQDIDLKGIPNVKFRAKSK